MRVRRLSALLGCAPLLVVALASTASAQRPDDPGSNGVAVAAAVRVCAAPPDGFASCHALRNDAADESGRSSGKPGGLVSGYGPGDIQSAYSLSGLTSGATVAIVDAYDDPTAEADLGVYRQHYGLPAVNSSGGPSFLKVNQAGGSTPPRANASWGQEISLDVDMVSATCPTCNILLVEANSNSFADLGAAVRWAKTQPGVVAVSNSYGGSDSAASSDYDAPFGVAITASTGDSGYGVESPASFGSVVAVGGTSLSKLKAGGFSETAWSGAGSGCSTLNTRPSAQTAVTGCNGKANADVSAVADPNTGVAVYDSTSYQGRVGWMKFGGTSASSPIIASVYALANNGGAFGADAAGYSWSHAGGLRDVTSGSNGSCATVLWCHAAAGWDGPTGLGTPNGTGAF
ncbi:MAG: hypothetical protein QOJ79_55 [Actinomycetota bacterium]|jgi:hypothetical protein|nr:hypothetical protein [Actinomycetota bacterium]